MQQREIEDLEKPGVDIGAVGLLEHELTLAHQYRLEIFPHHRLDLGKGLLSRDRHQRGCKSLVDDPRRRLFITVEQVDACRFAMKIIIAPFEPDIQKDQEGCRESDGQSCYIQCGIAAVPPKVSESDFEIIV